jgi:hypothetical protein
MNATVCTIAALMIGCGSSVPFVSVKTAIPNDYIDIIDASRSELSPEIGVTGVTSKDFCVYTIDMSGKQATRTSNADGYWSLHDNRFKRDIEVAKEFGFDISRTSAVAVSNDGRMKVVFVPSGGIHATLASNERTVGYTGRISLQSEYEYIRDACVDAETGEVFLLLWHDASWFGHHVRVACYNVHTRH